MLGFGGGGVIIFSNIFFWREEELCLFDAQNPPKILALLTHKHAHTDRS